MTAQPEEKPGGKGRPTPKRSDAEKARKMRVKTPTNSREATKHQRAQVKSRRREAREALVTGDITKMAPRDAGPVRAFVRDYVDRRRNAGTLFLPAAIIIFGLNIGGLEVMRIISNALLLAVVLAIAIDARNLGRNMLREVETRFPGAETKGLRMYAITRALQIRRLRLPKPRVKRGDPI